MGGLSPRNSVRDLGPQPYRQRETLKRSFVACQITWNSEQVLKLLSEQILKASRPVAARLYVKEYRGPSAG